MTGYTVFQTAHGLAGIGWRGGRVTRFRLPGQPPAAGDEPPSEIAAVIAVAQRYFAGEQVDFATVPVDLGAQEPFFAQVYNRVRRLGWGETLTYGAIARELGAGPEAARDVGQAMARNPVPLIVPCHRVLAAGGKVGGFSAPGGSEAKARMLALEGWREPAPAQAGFGF